MCMRNSRGAGRRRHFSAIGSIPAIDGKQSLLMGNAQYVTFHLASAEPATRLSFSARVLATTLDTLLDDLKLE